MDDISNPERSRHMDQQDMGMWCGAEPGLAVNLFGMLLAVAWSAGASRITSLLIFWIVLPVLLCLFPISCPCPCHRPYLCLSTGPCVVVLAIALIFVVLLTLSPALRPGVSPFHLALARPRLRPCFPLSRLALAPPGPRPSSPSPFLAPALPRTYVPLPHLVLAVAPPCFCKCHSLPLSLSVLAVGLALSLPLPFRISSQVPSLVLRCFLHYLRFAERVACKISSCTSLCNPTMSIF